MTRVEIFGQNAQHHICNKKPHINQHKHFALPRWQICTSLVIHSHTFGTWAPCSHNESTMNTSVYKTIFEAKVRPSVWQTKLGTDCLIQQENDTQSNTQQLKMRTSVLQQNPNCFQKQSTLTHLFCGVSPAVSSVAFVVVQTALRYSKNKFDVTWPQLQLMPGSVTGFFGLTHWHSVLMMICSKLC